MPRIPLPPISTVDRTPEEVADAIADGVIDMVNKERARQGLPPISDDDEDGEPDTEPPSDEDKTPTE